MQSGVWVETVTLPLLAIWAFIDLLEKYGHLQETENKGRCSTEYSRFTFREGFDTHSLSADHQS
jgi:hypothetical protein